MLLRFLLVLGFALFASALSAQEGVISIASAHNVSETASRLESVVSKKGMTVFNRVKHSEAANKVGLELRPTELLIFGNPKIGSKLMACQQSIGLDLPQKALVWEDEKGAVWVSYNSPNYLKKRHEVKGCDEVFAKVEKVLAKFVESAAAE